MSAKQFVLRDGSKMTWPEIEDLIARIPVTKDGVRVLPEFTEAKTCGLLASGPTFDDGVLWAAAWIVQEHDQPTMAGEMLAIAQIDTTKADEADEPFIKLAIEAQENQPEPVSEPAREGGEES